MNERDVRAALVSALEADLIGPFVPDEHPQGGQEILPIAPSRWYLTGFLAPQEGRKPDEEDAESVGELPAGDQLQTDDAGSEEPEPKRPMRFPASMGLSVFLPPGKDDSLEVDVYYADYDRIEVEQDHSEKKLWGWKRVAYGPVRVSVLLDAEALKTSTVPVPESRGLVLKGELRETEMEGLPEGTRVLSLFLVNQRTPQDIHRDHAFVFQVRLELRFEAGFYPRPNRRGEDTEDDDQRVLALNFRDRVEWAVGHNTSVQIPVVEQTPQGERVRCLKTTQLPRYEVPQVQAVVMPDVTTAMAELAKLDGPGLVNALTPLVERYDAWIDENDSEYLPRESLVKVRKTLTDKARETRDRIAAGIDLLKQDAEIRRAFVLANQSMDVSARVTDRHRPDKRYDGGRVPEWRPFQLAFILMNLASVADPKHAHRKLAELIYFPTGGGKTEAYLGLIAFTLLLRRLRGQSEDHEGRGVAVILRYTLRLLTLDQLDRAATLVCTLEEIRRRHPKELGNSRFTIGLWVGKSTTANRLSDVHKELSDFSAGKRTSPFPLANCPWCKTEIKIENIKLVDEQGKPTKKNFCRAVVYCDGSGCLYSEAKEPGRGLPVLFVDEQIYQDLPCFIVATVDKFAMMPWRGEAGMLFGRATHITDERAYGVMHSPPKSAKALPNGLWPPELIVQDELHLISGPLGTMVGLYEAAVDFLCEESFAGTGSRPPKVVCSTATVRRAREQIRALFGRDMTLFPPRGINEGDNFFARTASLEEKPGRLYVGVGAPGRALRAVSVRSYATLLAAAQKHFDKKGDPKQPADPYMTLIGYFNSLRELGGMRRLVDDEVSNRVAHFDEQKRPMMFVGPHPWADRRDLLEPAELTSRVGTDTVKETKARLAVRRTDKDAGPLDVVLASNMISVGLDVDRLGLMVVTGQPKTTSEYIQATSRVGRNYPGLVVTALNVMRPRDRSHFERFSAYHESFYREVEATSVTPYSGQSLDRGLVGTLLSMVRHGSVELEGPTGVMKLHQHRSTAEQALEWLVTRARGHRDWHDDTAETRIAELIRARGRNFFDAWERVVDKALEGSALRSYSPYDPRIVDAKALLFTAIDERPPEHDAAQFEAPTSMRDVEPSVHVWLRYLPLDSRS